MDKFLERNKFPKLTREETDHQGSPISLKETGGVVEDRPTKRTPGPEGITGKFPKPVGQKLCQLHTNIFLKLKRKEGFPRLTQRRRCLCGAQWGPWGSPTLSHPQRDPVAGGCPSLPLGWGLAGLREIKETFALQKCDPDVPAPLKGGFVPSVAPISARLRLWPARGRLGSEAPFRSHWRPPPAIFN